MPTGYILHWVGWNNSENHDKIWGYLCMNDGRYYCFWGRRGKQLSFKSYNNDRLLVEKKAYEKKTKKGYRTVSSSEYNTLVKDFLDEVEIWCTTAILTDRIR